MARLYPGMAFTNIKNNRRIYLPYMISCVLTIAIYYIIGSLADNENIAELWGGNIIQSYMNLGQGIVTIFAAIFLFYINSFLMKQRKSEFGLYNILGMEKRHIARVIGLETIYVFLAVMGFGLFFGILLDKLMYLVILKLLDAAAVPLGFYVSGSAISQTFDLFGLIFLLMLASSVFQIHKAKPVELLKSDNTGEREPKARWLLAALGAICLASGYFIAVTTENPVAAFALFFIAVILVIIGTYLLFTAGSVALLKLLRKNKGYYYKTKHFISVSGMMYRMKRNAVGLANICILSTMVLVMISATLSMYLGLDDSFQKRYPSEIAITAMADDPLMDDAIQIMEQSIEAEGLTVIDPISYRDLSISAVYEEEQNAFVTAQTDYTDMSVFRAYNNLRMITFVPLEDYNRSMGTSERLKDDEVLVYSNRIPLETQRFEILDQSFAIKKTLNNFMGNGNAASNIMSSHFIVVKDMDVMKSMYDVQKEVYGEYASYISATYMADVSVGGAKDDSAEINSTGNSGDKDSNIGNSSTRNQGTTSDDGTQANPTETANTEQQDLNDAEMQAVIRAYETARTQIYSDEMSAVYTESGAPFSQFTGSIDCRSVERGTFGTDFTGLFFIGIFLGFLFIVATVLIMYYKQITEGYEDQKRFEILQNVGMSHREVRQSINSQILTVFFLPLITAGIHVAFAFPFLFKIMTLLNLFNLKLFAMCTIGCFLAFAAFYTIVYLLTSRLYYRIVKK